MDADAEVSWQWKADFKIGGYPTVVLAVLDQNQDLKEIGRLVGYRPLKQTLKWLKDQRELRDHPVHTVKAEIDALPVKLQGHRQKELQRIGQWLADRGEYESAQPYFAGVKTKEGKKAKLDAQLQIAKKTDDRDQISRTLKALIAGFADAPEYAGWVLDLMDIAPTDAKALLGKAKKSLDGWRKNPNLAESDYSPGDLWEIEGALFEAASDKASAQAAYASGAKYFDDLAKKSHLKVARGARLEQAYCYLKAGNSTEAKKLYENLIEIYGNEFTFNYNYANALFQLKEYDRAHELAVKAEENAYGDNWLRAVALRAKINLARNRATQAHADLQKALAQVVLPPLTHIRSHRYVAQLRKLLDQTTP